MLNGAARKAIYATVGALTVLSIGGAVNFVAKRASAESVKENKAGIAANADRLTSHEREADARMDAIQGNQRSIATSIDFLVRAQDPHRAPIAPTIEAPAQVPAVSAEPPPSGTGG